MAFCRNCGAEVNENAYVCTKCGSLVNPSAKIKEKIDKDSGILEFRNTVSFWLLFVAGIFLAISVLFFNLSINNISGFTVIHGTGGHNFYMYPDLHLLVFDFITSCIVLILCVLSYALSFKYVKLNVISKTTNLFLLLSMIASIVYAFAKFMMIF